MTSVIDAIENVGSILVLRLSAIAFGVLWSVEYVEELHRLGLHAIDDTVHTSDQIVISEEGDDTDAACFTYEIVADEAQGTEVAVITGLTEAGREKNSLIVPSSYEGRRVTLFEADVFQGHTRLASVVIPSSIMMIFDGSFSGCTRLQEIRLRHEIPCGVGQDLFAGTDGFRICVPADAVELFATHYNWGAYKEYLVGYES